MPAKHRIQAEVERLGESRISQETGSEGNRRALTCLVLDMQHHIFKVTLGDKLCLSPLSDGAKRVLDLGTGSGIWSIEYGECPLS